MEIEIVVAVIGLSGIAISSILGSLGYFLKSRIESKKNARKVLYYLLEIRHSIRSSLVDPNESYKEFCEFMESSLAKRGLPIGRADVEPLIGPLLLAHFTNMINSTKPELNERLLESYENALSELSYINPVVAYRLRGRESLQEAINHTRQYATELESTLAAHGTETLAEMEKELLNFGKKVRKDTIKEMCSEIDKDVLSVAKICGIYDYYSCRKIIRSNPKLKSSMDSPEIHLMLDQMVAIVKNAVSKASFNTSPD